MEYISIHCKDIQVIKKLIDFSMFSTYYKVISISTLSIHLYEDIDYCTVFVIQKDVIKDVHSFFKQLKKRYLNSIAIVYICDELDDDIEMELNTFLYKRVVLSHHTFYDLIYMIVSVVNEKNCIGRYENQIRSHFRTLHIKENQYGYTYLKSAILLKIKDSKMKMYTIYDRIAREYHVTSSRVERCMRTAIESAYTSHEKIYEIVYGFDIRPSCARLIMKVVDEIIEEGEL